MHALSTWRSVPLTLGLYGLATTVLYNRLRCRYKMASCGEASGLSISRGERTSTGSLQSAALHNRCELCQRPAESSAAPRGQPSTGAAVAPSELALPAVRQPEFSSAPRNRVGAAYARAPARSRDDAASESSVGAVPFGRTGFLAGAGGGVFPDVTVIHR